MIKRSIKKPIPLKSFPLLQEPHLITSINRPWDLSLTHNQELPVYRNYKRGHPIITIRKIKGEIDTLGKELQKFISSDCILVRSDLDKIYVKGDYLDAINKFFDMNLNRK